MDWQEWPQIQDAFARPFIKPDLPSSTQVMTYAARRERQLANQRRLASLVLGIAVAGDWRWASHEDTEWLKHSMKIVGAFAPFILAFGFENLLRLP